MDVHFQIPPDVTLQQIAAEMNLSETVFLTSLTDGQDFKTGQSITF